MKTLRRISVLVLFSLILFCLSGCTKSNDGPPDPGTPEPAPLDGTFVCDIGTFVFNGDGKSVTVDLEGDISELIPDGEMEYYFKWYNFGLCRYDVASVMELYHEGKGYEFDVYSASETQIELKYRADSKEFSLKLVKEG